MAQRSRFDTAALPRVGDPAAAARGLARWARLGGADRAAPAGDELEAALAALFGNSPYLGESALAEPDVVHGVLRDGPDALIAELIEQTRDTPLGARQRFMAALRRADLLLEIGAGLEEGWLPAAQRGARNRAINAGEPGAAYNDTDDTRNDIGAYGGPDGDW